MWIPRFACPECGGDLNGADAFRTCAACDRQYARREDIWRFLSAARAAEAEPFVRQYRSIRERDGRRKQTAEYYRLLPHVAAGDTHATEWRVRRESYEHLLSIVQRSG